MACSILLCGLLLWSSWWWKDVFSRLWPNLSCMKNENGGEKQSHVVGTCDLMCVPNESPFMPRISGFITAFLQDHFCFWTIWLWSIRLKLDGRFCKCFWRGSRIKDRQSDHCKNERFSKKTSKWRCLFLNQDTLIHTRLAMVFGKMFTKGHKNSCRKCWKSVKSAQTMSVLFVSSCWTCSWKSAVTNSKNWISWPAKWLRARQQSQCLWTVKMKQTSWTFVLPLAWCQDHVVAAQCCCWNSENDMSLHPHFKMIGCQIRQSQFCGDSAQIVVQRVSIFGILQRFGGNDRALNPTTRKTAWTSTSKFPTIPRFPCQKSECRQSDDRKENLIQFPSWLLWLWNSMCQNCTTAWSSWWKLMFGNHLLQFIPSCFQWQESPCQSVRFSNDLKLGISKGASCAKIWQALTV